jgi:hypothetical protein
MRNRIVWTLLSALLLTFAVSISLHAHPPLALAQGDDGGEIEPVESDDEQEITPVPSTDDEATLEPSQGEEFPIGTQPPPPPVEPTEPFRVEVLCEFSPAAGVTECAFTGMPPAGYAGPAVFLVPVELACAAVVGGQYAYAAPDPVIGLNGFRPTGSEGWLTLDLDGVVTPSGTATYWFQTPSGVVPATGPGLACAPAPTAPAPTPQPTSTVTPVPTTGSLLVRTLACVGVPEDRSGYDWFGQCDRLTYHLAPAGMQVTPPPVPNVPAEALFEDVPPGTYELEAMGFTWCHAESDNVNSDSQVIVAAGARTTVWIFLCQGS